MPMMFGFSGQRRQLLEAEAQRFAAEAYGYGALRAYLVGDLAAGRVGPETELEIVVIQETDEPFHRRADFWVAHIRPRVGTRFLVYTPDEFEAFEEDDLLLLEAVRVGEVLVG
ncbi:MAG: hypothetical protein M3O34_20175 [Chloroflexota bacterium]|nr:hypothetical protein [Chloroflexota bacterium]